MSIRMVRASLSRACAVALPLLTTASASSSSASLVVCPTRQLSVTPSLKQHTMGRPQVQHQTQTNLMQPCPFGLLLDIDGVLQRGQVTLPRAIDTFEHITDHNGQFLVPTVFVTNAGNQLRAQKAESLTERLGVPIRAEQVVMSHSPLSQFRQYHDRHILAVGQGPIAEIAGQLGFTQVTTLDNLRSLYPHLDCTQFRRRERLPYAGEFDSFEPIEAIVLFGEPLAWETALQLILDVLLTDGQPGNTEISRGELPAQQMPILACNTDLLWMAESTPLPRIGHGVFLMCLETLYEKLTQKSLVYSALAGKPNEITYHHAAYTITQEAVHLGMPPPTNVYAIGDNPESDILGANLFDEQLRKNTESRRRIRNCIAKFHSDGGKAAMARYDQNVSMLSESEQDAELLCGVQRCYSVLVRTGVYSADCNMNGTNKHDLLRTPSIYEEDILSAVRMIAAREHWSPQ